MAVDKITDNFDRALNPHPNLMDFEHEIRCMQILAAPSHPYYQYLMQTAKKSEKENMIYGA